MKFLVGVAALSWVLVGAGLSFRGVSAIWRSSDKIDIVAGGLAYLLIPLLWTAAPVFVVLLLVSEGGIKDRFVSASIQLGIWVLVGFLFIPVGWYLPRVFWACSGMDLKPRVRITESSNADSRGTYVAPRTGDSSARGGSPTVRSGFYAAPDDPWTTNDESNDQPVGYFGTVTLSVYSVDSGNYYTLDGDVNGTELERLYFPKGGWIDFLYCELDENLEGECDDEEGRTWGIEGEF